MVTNAVKHVIVMEHHVMLLLEHVTAQPEKCCPSVLKVRTSIIFSFLTNLDWQKKLTGKLINKGSSITSINKLSYIWADANQSNFKGYEEL